MFGPGDYVPGPTEGIVTQQLTQAHFSTRRPPLRLQSLSSAQADGLSLQIETAHLA